MEIAVIDAKKIINSSKIMKQHSKNITMSAIHTSELSMFEIPYCKEFEIEHHYKRKDENLGLILEEIDM